MRMWKHDGFSELRAVALIFVFTVAFQGGMRQRQWACDGSSFGINYGKIANNLPPPAEVVEIIMSLSVSRSKLYDTDPLVLQTFGHTGISFVVGIPNEELQELASNASLAREWVYQKIAVHLPATHIVGIVVGNEIFSGTDTTLMAQVVPAMQNVRTALTGLGLQEQITVSTAHSFSTLAASYPPSAGAFSPAIAEAYMRPVLEFLAETGAPFLINVYPFFAYKDNPGTIPLDYVLFKPNAGVLDEHTGLRYYNMFDAQMDAVYSAIDALGFRNLTLLVSETGWPSAGDVDEPGASVANAQTYHANLVAHVTSRLGTPLRPNTSLDVYLFALFNEDQKPGPTSERNYGLFRPDGSKVYTFDFQQASLSPPPSAPPSVLRIALLLFLFLRFPSCNTK